MIPKKDVIEMTNALTEACEFTIRNEVKKYKFAKNISYMSLFIAILLILMEVYR
jgi:hypothetical protein